MSKRYVSYRSDLADKAAWDAEIASSIDATTGYPENIANYPVGKMVVTADGNLNIVSVQTLPATITTIAVGAQIA